MFQYRFGEPALQEALCSIVRKTQKVSIADYGIYRLLKVIYLLHHLALHLTLL
jgi:hypothetical protein